MKKKLLISLLPALMALGSCAGNAPQANGQFYQEDTLLHEEIFGDVSSLLNKVKRNALPEDVDPAEPRIGVQYAEDRTGETLNSVSVRYVAAFKVDAEKELSSYTATWTRSAYNADGSQRFASEKVNCTKVYTSLNEGEGTIEPSDFGDYNYFVVYTLRNIPAAQLGGALCASITVDDGEGGADPVISKTIATRLDTESKSVRASFTAEDFDEDGYFIARSTGLTPADGTTRGDNDASFTLSNLTTSDSFSIVYHDTTTPKFQLFGHSSILADVNSNYLFSSYKGKLKANNAGNYVVFLNDSNLYVAIENGYYLTGDFANWKLYSNNIMGSSQTDIAVKTNFDVAVRGDFKIVAVNNGNLYWYGTEGEGTSNLWLEAGNYDLYLNSSYHVTATKNSAYSFEVWPNNDEKGLDGDVYVHLTNGSEGKENAPTPGVLLTSLDESGNNYVVNYYEGYDTATFNYVVSGEIKKHIDITIADIGNGCEIKTESWDEQDTHKFAIRYKRFGSSEYTVEDADEYVGYIVNYTVTFADGSNFDDFKNYGMGLMVDSASGEHWADKGTWSLDMTNTNGEGKIWTGSYVSNESSYSFGFKGWDDYKFVIMADSNWHSFVISDLELGTAATVSFVVGPIVSATGYVVTSQTVENATISIATGA